MNGGALRAALSYFTVLPVGAAEAPTAAALAWLPLVGAIVGALAGTLGSLVGLVAPHGFAVVAAFGASIALTGALHVDGFLDTSDALFASVTPERRLEILRDPRHGTFAIAAFAVVAAAWFVALDALPVASLPLACAFAGCAARFAAVLNARAIPYGRGGEPTAAFAERPSAAVLAVGVLLALALAVPLGPVALAGVPLAALAARLFGRWARGRFGGGLTGDAYGFAIVVLDVALLAALAMRG